MKIRINNSDAAEMPVDVVKNCEQLLARQMKTIPKIGAPYEVLYSEKDPLGKSDEIDDEAFFIYFTVTEILPQGETDVEKLTIGFDLIF